MFLHFRFQSKRRMDPVQHKFHNSDMFRSIMKDMNDLRVNGSFVDVTFVVGQRRFPAHRNVMAAAHPYFRTMFQSGLEESRTPDVEMVTEPDAFAVFLEYTYTGVALIGEDNVLPLFLFSKLIGEHCLRDECLKVMEEQMSPPLAVQMLNESRLRCNTESVSYTHLTLPTTPYV